MDNNEIWVSASRLGTKEECDLKHYNRYIKKIKVFSYTHPAANIGTGFHKVAELMHVRKKYTLDDMLGFVDEAWKLALVRGVMRKHELEPEAVEVHKGKIRSYVKHFYKFLKENDLLGKPALFTEAKFAIKWTPPGTAIKIVINGFIDLGIIIAGKVHIVDYKTQKDIPKQKEVDENTQLTMYEAAYRWMAKNRIDKDWPEKAEKAELWFPQPKELVVVTAREKTKEDFNTMKDRIHDVAKAHIEGRKLAKPSDKACKYCEYYMTQHCPATFHGGTT